ncbi:hypothetical protein QBC40DRAFT_104208 [Triangularia verruculosa]|uniref:Chromo domain-containing protein n=1 Tax=Triangularia verruculosa TaxID=2587418 RepID=A0AAN6XTG3_9PEZI|nr:hypothetical protein QBC40DRAFT_104208 [Triangularia verruculosa]
MPARKKARTIRPKFKYRQATRDHSPDQEYKVRGILAEKGSGRKLQYLIDWEDSSDGESYQPTWEPAKHANQLTIDAWEAEKRLKEGRKRPASALPAATDEDTARPLKKAKGDDSGYTSPEFGNTSPELGIEVDKIPDRAGKDIVLEIPQLSQLDRDDYQLYTASQLSSKGSQVDSASYNDNNEASTGKPHSQRTIPDSQATGESDPSLTIPETVLSSQSLAGGSEPSSAAHDAEREVQQALDFQVDSEQAPQEEREEHQEEHDNDDEEQQAGQDQDETHEQSKEKQRPSQEEESKTLDHEATISPHPESLIPSRQLDPLHPLVNRSHDFRDENHHLQSSIESGFLTQPDYSHLNYGLGEVGSTEAAADQDREGSQGSKVAVSEQRSTPAPIESSVQSANNILRFESPQVDSPSFNSPQPPSSSWHSQQAQLVDPIVPRSSDLDQIRTQSQEQSQSVEEVVPETTQKERTSISTAEIFSKQLVSDTRPARPASSGSVPPCSFIFPTIHSPQQRAETEPLRPVSLPTHDKMGSTPPPPQLSAVEMLRSTYQHLLDPTPVPVPVPESQPEPAPEVQPDYPQPLAALSEEVQSGHPQPSFPMSEAAHPQSSFALPEAGPDPSPMIAAPPSVRSLPRRSAVEDLREAIGLHNFLAPQTDHSTPGHLPAELPNELPVIGGHHQHLAMEYDQHLPTTVAPSDLTTSVDLSRVAEEGQAMPDSLFSVHDNEPLVTETIDSDHGVAQDIEENPIELRQFMVTLPMAANIRSQYVDAIAKNLQAMTEFGNIFSDSASQTPDNSLTAKIDNFFKDLNDLVDLPAYDKDVFHQLDDEGKVKHATNSNTKYSFVYEFLKALQWLNLRILIVSRPGRPLAYLEKIIAKEIHVSELNKTYAVLSSETPDHVSHDTSVILAEAGQDFAKIGGEVDVVVLFDHEARQVHLPPRISCDSTIYLSLATICSLEHILLQLREMESFPEMSALEIRNALCQMTALLAKHLKDPQHAPQPHEVAITFASFLENPENDIEYVAQPLPISVEEMWEGQPQTQVEHGEFGRRKRPLEDDQDVMSKRRKTARASLSVPMTELLRDTLAQHPIDNNSSEEVAEVPVAQLEALAYKIFKLESRCGDLTSINAKLRAHTDPLEVELESFRGTVKTLHVKYMEALNDRSKFEKDCKQATKSMEAAAEKLETSKAEVTTLKERNKTLENKLAEATLAMEQSAIPEIARFAQLEKELAETKVRAEKAEKKAASLNNEADFVRQHYQAASSHQQEQNDEMKRLRAEIADLKTRANDNIVKIQQIHANNELADHRRQLSELQAMVRDRERELDILRTEVQQLRNGRRETRGGSTPRSPRIGAMGGVIPSPRPGRASANSRGNSPAAAASSDPAVPGMSYAPAGASGRWNHLRD